MKHVLYKSLTVFLLLGNTIGALPAGYAFMRDPSGNALGITKDYLKFSPFSDFFIPGLVLFVVNGLFGVLTLSLIFTKSRCAPLYVFLQGILLGGWVIIQMIMLKSFHPLQLTFLLVALMLLLLGWFHLVEQRKSVC